MRQLIPNTNNNQVDVSLFVQRLRSGCIRIRVNYAGMRILRPGKLQWFHLFVDEINKCIIIQLVKSKKDAFHITMESGYHNRAALFTVTKALQVANVGDEVVNNYVLDGVLKQIVLYY